MRHKLAKKLVEL